MCRADTKFRQQKLRAWKPVMTPRNVLPTLVFLGVIFIAVGAGLYVTSAGVTEYKLDYTNCVNVAAGPDNGKECATLVLGNDNREHWQWGSPGLATQLLANRWPAPFC